MILGKKAQIIYNAKYVSEVKFVLSYENHEKYVSK